MSAFYKHHNAQYLADVAAAAEATAAVAASGSAGRRQEGYGDRPGEIKRPRSSGPREADREAASREFQLHLVQTYGAATVIPAAAVGAASAAAGSEDAQGRKSEAKKRTLLDALEVRVGASLQSARVRDKGDRGGGKGGSKGPLNTLLYSCLDSFRRRCCLHQPSATTLLQKLALLSLARSDADPAGRTSRTRRSRAAASCPGLSAASTPADLHRPCAAGQLNRVSVCLGHRTTRRCRQCRRRARRCMLPITAGRGGRYITGRSVVGVPRDVVCVWRTRKVGVGFGIAVREWSQGGRSLGRVHSSRQASDSAGGCCDGDFPPSPRPRPPPLQPCRL